MHLRGMQLLIFKAIVFFYLKKKKSTYTNINVIVLIYFYCKKYSYIASLLLKNFLLFLTVGSLTLTSL